MKKIVNDYVKNQMKIGFTGVGLGIMSGLDSTGSVGKLTKAVPIMSNLNTLDAINKSIKKIK